MGDIDWEDSWHWEKKKKKTSYPEIPSSWSHKTCPYCGLDLKGGKCGYCNLDGHKS